MKKITIPLHMIEHILTSMKFSEGAVKALELIPEYAQQALINKANATAFMPMKTAAQAIVLLGIQNTLSVLKYVKTAEEAAIERAEYAAEQAQKAEEAAAKKAAIMNMVASKTWLHYGSNKFESSMFEHITNSEHIKPHGGLWACPIDSTIGWDKFAKANEIGLSNDKFEFKVNKNANIMVIDSYNDLCNLAGKYFSSPIPGFSLKVIDFERMLKDGWDGIYLTSNGLGETRDDTKACHLYGWDVESLLVMNPNIIE